MFWKTLRKTEIKTIGKTIGNLVEKKLDPKSNIFKKRPMYHFF